MKIQRIIIFALILFLLIGCSANKEPDLPKIPESLKSLIIDSPATKMPDFSFVDHNGKSFNNANFKDKWSLVFFGYTNCPDVCPTSMSVLDKVSRMPDIPTDVQYVFVSVDPKRDTPDKLKDFVTYFNEGFIGATGTKSEIDKFKESLGVIYDFEGDTSKDDYIVSHFAAIYMIDPRARERAYVLPPHSAKQIAEAFKLIYQTYNS